jgi:hypothetical protein
VSPWRARKGTRSCWRPKCDPARRTDSGRGNRSTCQGTPTSRWSCACRFGKPGVDIPAVLAAWWGSPVIQSAARVVEDSEAPAPLSKEERRLRKRQLEALGYVN